MKPIRGMHQFIPTDQALKRTLSGSDIAGERTDQRSRQKHVAGVSAEIRADAIKPIRSHGWMLRHGSRRSAGARKAGRAAMTAASFMQSYTSEEANRSRLDFSFAFFGCSMARWMGVVETASVLLKSRGEVPRLCYW